MITLPCDNICVIFIYRVIRALQIVKYCKYHEKCNEILQDITNDGVKLKTTRVTPMCYFQNYLKTSPEYKQSSDSVKALAANLEKRACKDLVKLEGKIPQ